MTIIICRNLYEDDGDFMHRRLKVYLIRNPEVNESLNQSNPLTPKILSPNLTQKTSKAPAAMKTKSESPVVNSAYQSPKRRKIIQKRVKK